MRLQSSSRYLLGTASALALLASIGAPTTAQAQVSSATRGLYFGGSTLASEAFRQIIDCYNGSIVGSGTAYSDGFKFNSGFPGPGLLPTSCTSPIQSSVVNILYAGVGSGNGVRGYIGNDPVQWFSGTPAVGAVTGLSLLPALQPAMIDLANPGTPATKFGSYPYPRVDAGLSDSPLAFVGTSTTLTTIALSFNPAQSWTTVGGALSAVTVNSTTTVSTYNGTNWGTPVQVPAFEVNVAIPVNLANSAFTIHSKVVGAGTTPGTQANQGAAIQLTSAQLCAIFSGLVTDWDDTTANKIPYLDNTGTQQLAAFNYTNNSSAGVATAFSSSSKTIKVVFRSDGSGTSFILTQYLKAVCPLLDDAVGTYGYKSIFGNANLPSTSFSTLIGNINADTVHRPSGSTTTAAWIGASGSAGVASSVSDDTGTTNAGRIGYVSADFTRPYTTQVAVSGGTVGAPLSAAVQNEALRIAGTYVPNNSVVPPATLPASLTFLAPTPVNAGNAWGDPNLQTPNTGWTWVNYNVYSNTFVSPTTTHGGVTVTGLPVLPLTSQPAAYPLSGATFLDLYSCYKNLTGDAGLNTRTLNITTFLTWYYGTVPTSIMQNAGFNPVPAGYATNIRNTYLVASSSAHIAAAGAAGACSSATGAM